MRQQPWLNYHVKDSSKGPMVWQVKHLLVYLKDEDGLPTRAHHLMVARNILDPTKVKYFLSNAPPATAIETLLLVAFSRWKIERMFEDSKMELGMDHFEVRKFGSIRRHLILSCVSHLFLAEFHQAHTSSGSTPGDTPGSGGKKPEPPDAQPGRNRGEPTDPGVAAWGPLFEAPCRTNQRAIDDNTTAQCQGRPQPSQANDSTITRHRHHAEPNPSLPVAAVVAL